ncbi:hypothetical protein FRC01_008409 [Tulasnella sp. 417]|nr:hypothetical protein FRC01_008409 [Tulasnella sp. 417]
MGSPSLTSIHNTRFSWDWNFSNPGSPRSTVYSKHETGTNTPPASLRSVPHGAGSTDGHGVSPNASVSSLPLHPIPHPHPPGVPHAGNHAGHVRSRSRTSTSGSADAARPGSTSPTRARNHTRIPSYHHEPDVNEEEEENNAEEMRAIDAELEKLGVVLSLSPEHGPMFDEPLANDGDYDAEGAKTPGGYSDCLATPHMHAMLQPELGGTDQDALGLPDVSSSASSLSPQTPPSGLPSQLLLESNSGANDPSRTASVTILSASRPNTPRSSPVTQGFFGTKEPASGTGTFKAPKSPVPPAAITPTNSSAGASATVKEGSRSRLWKKVKKALPDRRSSQSNVKESLTSPLEGGDAKKLPTSAARMFKLERPWSRT